MEENILHKFSNVKQTGNSQYQCLCPVHNDNKASLTITIKEDKTLLHCHAGCSTVDILNSKGLTLSDLFTEKNYNIPTSWKDKLKVWIKNDGRKLKLEDIYPYTDMQGNILYYKLRYEGKKIIYCKVENDKVIYKDVTKGIDKQLYNNIVFKTLKEGDRIYIVEGEKDVHTLTRLDMPAVTPGGAGDWNTSFSKLFNGLDVVILQDNDVPGKQFASQVKRDLDKYAAKCKIVTTSKLDHGDVTDYIEMEGHTKQELLDLIESKKNAPTEQEQETTYIEMGNNGYKINTGLLAEHIRNNLDYQIVRKQGYENAFIYCYENGYYKLMSSNEFKGKIKGFIPKEIRKPYHWEDTYKELVTDKAETRFEDLDSECYLINFKNGIYNVNTRQLEPHNPSHLMTIQVNSNYMPTYKKPTQWLDFMNSLSMGDDDILKCFQEWLGLNISNYPAWKLKKAVWLHSPRGNTGKTLFLNMIAYLIGEDHVCTTPVQDWGTKSFGTGSLYGAGAIIIDDQKKADISDSSIFKSVTGGGMIEINVKFKQSFSYRVNAPITISCNGLPYIKDDKGDHMFNRLLIMPCYKPIPSEEVDRNLFDKLIQEADSIAMWALEGLHRLVDNNFNITESILSKQAVEEFRKNNDTLYRYISENCIITNDPKDKILKSDFEARYNAWAIKNQYNPVDKKNIKDRLEAYGIVCIKYVGNYCYKGMIYNDNKNFGDFGA